jgi:selenoprotein W-related protein
VARLLEGWGAVLESVDVVAGTGGIFDIHVDGERVFEKRMLGRYPQPDDVLPLISERIGPEVMRRS